MKYHSKDMRGYVLPVVAALAVVVAGVVLLASPSEADQGMIEPDTSWYTGDASGYEVGTAQELAGLAQLVNGGNTLEGVTIALTSDIDLTGHQWTPIGDGVRSGSGFTGDAFSGTFDGNGHTISGLSVPDTYSGDSAAGLFGIVSGGTVKDLTLTDVSISIPQGELVGSVAGMLCNGSTVSGCTVGAVNDGSMVSGAKGVGGVVGRMTISSTITGCTNNAVVQGSGSNIGGIVGAAYYTEVGSSMEVSDCTNNGKVSGQLGVGGIVGLSAADISDCTNTAAITSGGYSVGGIAGEQKNAGSIIGCTNTADIINTVSSAYGSGGIVGWVRYSTETGYGLHEVIAIRMNDNSGNVSGGNDAGGIVGTLYNYGRVSGNINTAASLSATSFSAGVVGNYQSIGTTVPSLVSGNNWASVTGNASSTPIQDITGTNKDLYVYNNDPSRCSVSRNVTNMVASVDGVGYPDLQSAIYAAHNDTVTILTDITSNTRFTIDHTVTIVGGGHTVTVTGGDRVFNIFNAPPGTVVSISDLVVDATDLERGINLSGNGPMTLVLEDVDITANHYALNVASFNTLPTIDVTGGSLAGYCAFQTWSNSTKATFTGTTMNGVNQWTEPGDNSFATIVVNSNITGAAITLSGCTVTASETASENPADEYVFITNSGSSATIVLKDSTRVVPVPGTPVSYLSQGTVVTDDGTTVFTGYDSTASTLGTIASSEVTGGTAYYANIVTALGSGNSTVTLDRDLVSEAPLEIPEGTTFVVPEGKIVSAVLTTDGGVNSISLDSVTAGAGGFSVYKGSLVITGSFGTTTVTSEPVTLTGDVRISGTVDAPVTVAEGATVTIPAGQSLSVASNGGIAMSSGSTLVSVGTMTGKAGSITMAEGASASSVTINASDSPTVQGMIESSSGLKVTQPVAEQVDMTGMTAEQIQSEIDQRLAVELTGDLTLSEGTITISAPTSVVLSGTITITDTPTTSGGSLEIQGATVTRGADGAMIAVDGGSLILTGADVRVPVVVDEDSDAYVSVTKAKTMTVEGDSTADLGVGYGNTLILSNLTVPAGKSVDTWGDVVFHNTVVIQKGATLDIHEGGSASVVGTLNMQGTATVSGSMTVDGIVNVINVNGGALFTVTGDDASVDVADSGEFNVLKGKNRGAVANILDIDSGSFTVHGALTVTGTLSGNVHDKGAVTFNGTAGDAASITIYDGVSVTVSSVLGQIAITDAFDGEDIPSLDVVSGTNTVTLSGIKGVTVSTSETQTIASATGQSGQDRVRYHSLGMTVTGSFTSVDSVVSGTIRLANSATSGWNPDVPDCKIVIGDVTLGKGVVMTIDTASAEVAGTVNVSAQGSDLEIVGAPVDVEGSIVNTVSTNGASAIDIESSVNAVMYETSSEDLSTTTYTYTTLADALSASAETLEVYGAVTIDTGLTVPAGTTLDLGSASMTIDAGGVLTVASTATLDGGSGSIDVVGKLVIEDSSTGFDAPRNLTYQVNTVDGDSTIYSGLLVALADAESGDTIVLNGTAGLIDRSVTIPAGVTLQVPRGTILTIGSTDTAVTLTIAGDLQVSGQVVEATGASAKVVVTGSVTVVNGGTMVNSTDGSTGFQMSDYVTYQTRVDGRQAVVYSTMAYAAENVTNGTVQVIGTVSANDVTFTQAETGDDLVITVAQGNNLNVGILTLVGDGATLQVSGTMTGSVDTAEGSLRMQKASGVTVQVSEDDLVYSSADVVTVSGTIAGKVSVTSGDVNVGTLVVGTNPGDTFTVASGAILIVPTDATLTVQTMSTADPAIKSYNGLVVDGKLNVTGGTVSMLGHATVTGTVSVIETAGFDVSGMMTVTGTVACTTDVDGTAPYVSVTDDGVLVIGTAPSIGAASTFTGGLEIEGREAYAVAYAGSDMTSAIVNGSDGKYTSTVFTLNGTEYMTVYADSPTDVTLADVADLMEPEGYQDEVAWSEGVTGSMTIGTVGSVGATVEPGYVGLTVSAGVGLQVYIDGLSVNNYVSDEVKGFTHAIQYGKHMVSFAVESGYDGSKATITVNGVSVADGGSFTVAVGDGDVVVIASGAVPAQGGTVAVDDDDGMSLTDALLVVLVVVIVIMAIIVGLRMMRS